MTIEHTREIWRKASAKYRNQNPNYLREWQKANRDRCCAYSREWRKRNPRKVKEQEIQRRTIDRESYLSWRRSLNTKNREKAKQYRISRADEMRLYRKNFYQKHRERWNHYKQQRRTKEVIRPEHKKAIEAIYARARYFRQWFNVCVDHIIPLSKGGCHVPFNLQIIYKSENLIKARRLDYKPRVVFQ